VSAEPSNIMPFPTAQPTLEQAVQEWIEAKRREDQANAERLALEQVICELSPPPEEGSCTTELPGGMKLVMTARLKYDVDLQKLKDLCADLPVNRRPIKTTEAADETGLKWIRKNDPQTWAALAQAVTVRPMKTSLSVKF
jgi:hypothetical protein